jgi:hypothetical protein
MKRTNRPSRREFAGALAAAAVGPLVLLPASADEPALPRSVLDIAEGQAAIARARFGKHLNAEQMNAVVQSILRGSYAARALAHVKLRNSDEPAFAFRADLP